MRGNDVTWPQVTGSDPEVTSFDRKPPASVCRSLKTGVYCTFHFLQSSSLQEEAVTWGYDVTWWQVTRSDPDETWFHRKSPGSGCRRPKTGVYCIFHLLQGCSSQEEAVTWEEMMSHDFKWPEVTRKWRHLTGSHLEVAVGRKLANTVHFTSYKAVARRRQSRARKWRHVTSGDRKWPRSDVIITGSHLEVAVEDRKLPYTVHFTSYKAVARSRRQSRDRKWRHGTSGDRKWPKSYVIWAKVTWKWL